MVLKGCRVSILHEVWTKFYRSKHSAPIACCDDCCNVYMHPMNARMRPCAYVPMHTIAGA